MDFRPVNSSETSPPNSPNPDSPVSPTSSMAYSFLNDENFEHDRSPDSWEDMSDEDHVEASRMQDRRIAHAEDVFRTLRGYLDEPSSPGNIQPERYNPEDSQLSEHADEEAANEQDGVLSFTRNLAGLVRQNFQGIPTSPQRVLNEPATPSSVARAGNKKQQQVYKFTAVLMDPGDDSIPRGSFRAGLKNDGRIVQISLSRGAQEAGALRSLNSAFPFLRGASTNGGHDNFEILVTDKTSRNVLIPANRPPGIGFSARELHKISGQGSLYLRLIEIPSSQNQVPRQSTSQGRRPDPGFLYRQTYLPQVSTQVSSTGTSGTVLATGSGASNQGSLSGRPHNTSQVSAVSTSATERRSATGAGVSARLARAMASPSRTSTRTNATSTLTGTQSGRGHGRRFNERDQYPPSTSSSMTRINATGTGSGTGA
ncbi:hypothetical protein OS493_022746 [Desmophyllum pertusum]|uniref:Uncharacterized protein n=1 Tax=Desmophyllum pertusum TaxID=174260 RepID=A0A9X0CDL6_9CNID|nr:hypothetical protein OS493_022746 [Desmophyllum pertusum]